MTAPASLYVAAAGRPWVERRPDVHWKILYEDGDRRTILMRYEPGAVIPRHRQHSVRSAGGALVLAVMSGGTEPVPDGRS